MALSNVNIQIGQGGIGAPLPGTMHVCGIIIWADISGNVRGYPSGYGSNDYIKQYRSPEQADADGITIGDTGSPDEWADLRYHIDEFFALAPAGEVWAMIKDNTQKNFDDMLELQKEANGRIAQFGLYVANQTAFVTTVLDDAQASQQKLFGPDAPGVALVASDLSGITSGALPSNIDDLTTLTDYGVANVVGQDGANVGANLYSSLGYSLTNMGTLLGAIASAGMLVHLNLGYPRQFQMDHGAEHQVPAFGNGDLVKDYSKGQLDTLDDKHHIFMRTLTNVNGTFNNFSYTAAPRSNDLYTIERNRVMHLSYRRTKEYFQPELNAPIGLNPDGTLQGQDVDYYEDLAEEAHSGMVERGNISAVNPKVDPEQDVITNSELKLSIELLPTGVIKDFKVPVKYVTKTS